MRAILAAALALCSVLAFSADYYLPTCGTIGAGNDTLAWQTCINRVRADNGGRIITENRTYLTAALDATNLSGLHIVWSENARIDPVHMAAPAPVIDFSGSSNIRSTGGGEIYVSGPHAVWPTYAMRFVGQDKIYIEGLRTPGKFTSAALGFHGVHSVTIVGAQISQFDAAAPALWISNLAGRNSSDFASYNSEYHQGGGGLYTTVITQSDHIVFRDGISDNSVRSHILIQGTVRNLTSDSVKYYSELGGHAINVLEAVAPDIATFVRITNPFRDGIPYLTNPGGGFDQLRIETP